MSTTIEVPTLRFDEADMERANAEWSCNCGPSALAAAIGETLDYVRDKIPDFQSKGYTSPTMMAAAIANCGWRHQKCIACFEGGPYLLRIQFKGPWTEPGANPRWAYRYTHWIALWSGEGTPEEERIVFDSNGGLRTIRSWREEIAPLLMDAIPKCIGTYAASHVWHLRKDGGS